MKPDDLTAAVASLHATGGVYQYVAALVERDNRPHTNEGDQMKEQPLPAVIGIGGRAGAGKDVVADHLVNKHGYVKLGMSDALHEAMMKLDPIIEPTHQARYSEMVAKIGYVATKANFPEARRLLQTLGTEVGRDMIGPNVWADLMDLRVTRLVAGGHRVVLTGVRFPNELAVAARRGETWWVDRPGLNPGGGHSSETSLTSKAFMVMLHNTSTIEHLTGLVDAAVAR